VDKGKLAMFIVMLVTIVISVFSLSRSYDAENIAKKTEEGTTTTSSFLKIFADTAMGTAPLTVNFSSLLLRSEGTPKYSWEFGDGNTSNDAAPTHTYEQSGNYICNLTVADNSKELATSMSILATINRPPQVVVLVNLPTSNRPYIPGLTLLSKIPVIGDKIMIGLLSSNISRTLLIKQSWINCTAQVFDPEGDQIVDYKWEVQEPPVSFLGTQTYPIFTFEGKDLKEFTIPALYTFRWSDYTIKLTVTDSAGNTASDSKPFGISASNVELRRGKFITAWKSFWQTKFAYLPGPLQETVKGAAWAILTPFHNFTDRLINKVMLLLPENLSGIVKILYDSLWEQIEKTYRRPNNAPVAPFNPSPTDTATDVDLNADLSWNGTDPDGDPLAYDVYFGTTSTPPLVFSSFNDTKFDLGPLDSGTTYYWKIVAKDMPPTGDADSQTTSSPIWKFTTI